MKCPGHLFLEEVVLQPSGEWTIDADGWLFVRVGSGEACWIDRRDPQLLHSGDVVVVPSVVDRIFRASQLTPVVVNYFRFCPDLLVGLLSLAERSRLDRAADAADARARVFRSRHRLARRLADICAQPGDKGRLAVRCQLLQLAVTVLVEPEAPRVFGQAAFLSASKRAEVLFGDLTEAELLAHSTVELAQRCGCSVRHFAKLFRGFFGVSLHTKQRELRLIKARELLAESSLSVVDVAAAVGFSEQALFSMAFKKRFGISPTQWRRKIGRTGKGGSDPEQNGFS